MKTRLIQFQPKGGMCVACTHRLRACSYLDFAKMRPIGKYPDGTIIVKCTEFTKGDVKELVST